MRETERPWYARLSHAEQRLREALRCVDGKWFAGRNATVLCSRGCGLTYDPNEYAGCPGCRAYYAQQDRQRWAAIALGEQDAVPGIH